MGGPLGRFLGRPFSSRSAARVSEHFMPHRPLVPGFARHAASSALVVGIAGLAGGLRGLAAPSEAAQSRLALAARARLSAAGQRAGRTAFARADQTFFALGVGLACAAGEHRGLAAAPEAIAGAFRMRRLPLGRPGVGDEPVDARAAGPVGGLGRGANSSLGGAQAATEQPRLAFERGDADRSRFPRSAQNITALLGRGRGDKAHPIAACQRFSSVFDASIQSPRLRRNSSGA